jgi:Lrp/AsnC family transcriptional regulator for asnA, asnC and gidA
MIAELKGFTFTKKCLFFLTVINHLIATEPVLMRTKLDKVDMDIIDSLMRDGRKSFRQIAKEIGVSTPTVEARFSRMKSMGIVKNIEPIIDIDIIENQIPALVFLKANLAQSIQIADELAAIPEVRRIYMTTGENNIVAKVISDRPEGLEELVRKKIAPIEGINSISYQIITRTVKDSQSVAFNAEMFLKLLCDYCDNEITEKARVLKISDHQRYFCCDSCLILYEQKYKGRIEAINKNKSI